jgi:hypothetical protein
MMMLAAVLSPALLQPVDCGEPPSGDTTLSALSLEIGGTNQLLGFSSADRSYDAWNPVGFPVATLSATPTDGVARVTYSLDGQVGLVGDGAGSTPINLPGGTATLVVVVRPAGGARASYVIELNPTCATGGVCDDGNPCTIDGACDVPFNLCPFPAFESATTVCEGNQLCNGAGSCQGWGVPQLVDIGGNDAFYPSVAVNANGSAVAVWQQFKEGFIGRSDVVGAVYSPSTGWSSPELLETLDGIGSTFIPAESPQVVVDAAGNAIAVWTHRLPTELFPPNSFRTEIWTNRYEPGNGWLGPALLFGEEVHDLSLPRQALAASPDGTAFFVWKDYDQAFQFDSVKASHYTPGVGWSPQVDLDTGRPACGAGGAAANGKALAVWPFRDATNSEFRVSRFTAATQWSAPQMVVFEPTQSNPQLSVDTIGNAVLAWTETTGSYAIRFEPATGWTTLPQMITSAEVQGVAAAGGDAFTVWREVTSPGVPPGGEGRIVASRFSQGSWGTPVPILEGAGGTPTPLLYVSEPIIAANSAGDAIVTWAAPASNISGLGSPNMTAVRYVAGSGWQAPEEIEDNGARGVAFSPAVAYGGGGIMCVFADGNDSSVHDMWSAWFRP